MTPEFAPAPAGTAGERPAGRPVRPRAPRGPGPHVRVGGVLLVASAAAVLALALRHPAPALAGAIPVLLLASRALFGSVLAPLGVHGAVWMGTLALTSLRLSPVYQQAWSPTTWLALVGAEVCFAAGAVLVVLITGPRPGARRAVGAVDSRRLWLAICVIFGLGTAAFVVQVVAIGGIGVLITDPVGARFQFVLPGFGYLYAALYVVPGMVVVYRSAARRRRRAALVLAVLSVVFSSVTIARFGILMTLGITALCMAFVARNRRQRLRLVLVLGAAFLAFAVIGRVRENLGAAGRSAEDRIAAGEVRLPVALSALLFPYLYTVSGYENFDHQVRTAPGDAGGVYTFRALLHLTRIEVEGTGQAQGAGTRLPYTRGNWLNTSVHVADYYLDFGLAGVFVGSLALGFLSTYLFALRRRSFLMMLANAIVLYSLALTFFSNYFTYLPVIFLIVIALATHLWARTGPIAAPPRPR